MGLLKNKKGVEGLPFKYIIIALVAALVIGIALQFTNILGEGTISSAERISETLKMKTICESDEEPPVIKLFEDETFCINGTNHTNLTIKVNVVDECGVASVRFWPYNEFDTLNFEMSNEGDKLDGNWTVVYTINEELEEINGNIYASDESPAENQGELKDININCTVI